MKNIDKILATCVEDIESGRSTVEQCLEKHESVRAELEPLLRMAAGIKPPAPVKPSPEFKTNARARLMDYIHREQATNQSRASIFTAFNPFLRTGWVRVTSIIIAAILVLSLTGTGTAYASQESVPGEMLYPVKTFTEDFRVWIETDKSAEVALELEFAGKRLVEKSPESLSLAMSAYERNLNHAMLRIGKNNDQFQYQNQLKYCSMIMAGHVSRLDSIEDISREENISTINQTREMAMNQHSWALRLLSQYNGVQATEMNVQLMQNRLQRAYDTSTRGQKRKAEEALNQYVQLSHLGEEILQIAETSGQDTSGIMELNRQAAEQHMYQMGTIDGNISEDIKIETGAAIQNMKQNQGEDQQIGAGEPGNDSTGSGQQQQPTQTPGSDGNQQEPGNQQPPDGPGQESQSNQSGPGNGGGGK